MIHYTTVLTNCCNGQFSIILIIPASQQTATKIGERGEASGEKEHTKGATTTFPASEAKYSSA
jgi:hypothetical protein